MKKTFLFFIMLVLGNLAFAQNQFSFSVVSETDASAIEYVEVLVSATDSFESADVINYAVANEFGKGRLSMPNGTYYLKFIAVGYRPLVKKVDLPATKNVQIQLVQIDEMMGQTVVTIQSRPQSSTKAVERVLVVSHKDLDNRSVFNLRDALNQQMNVQIANSSSTGSAVSLMGVSGQNVKILIDGVPVIGRLDGDIDLSQINLNDVERIEVIEGPVSTSYGSNALAGVINIITRKKTSTRGEIMVDGYHETNGQDNLNLTAGKQIKKYNFRGGFGRNFFAGWNPTDEGRFDQWKPKEQYSGRLQVNRTGKKTELLLKTEFFDERLLNRGKPLPSYYETAFDEWFHTRRLDHKVQYNRQIDTNKRFSGYLALNQYERTRSKYFRDLTTLSSRQVVSDGVDDTTGFDALMARGTYSISSPKGIHTQIGYDIISQQGRGVRIENGSQIISDLALFVTSEITLRKKITLKPGLRAAYNTSYDAPLAPTLSARYKHKDYIYRMSYGRGFRAPDIKELYLFFVDVNHNVVGNPDLMAERSHNLQFSATGFHKAKKLLIRPSATVFYNNINDKITLANITGTQYTYINLDRFSSLGGNIRLGIAGNKTKFNMGMSTTHVTSVSNEGEGGEASFGYQEYNANVSRKLGAFTLNAFIKYTGSKTVFNLNQESGEIQESRIDAYSLADVQLGRAFADKKIQINVGIKNVFDVQNVQNQIQSGGVHTGSSANLAIGTGRSYFIKGIFRLTQ